MKRIWCGLVVGALTVGCAGRGDSATASPEPAAAAAAAEPKASTSDQTSGGPISPAAARIYMLGEERFAEGRFAEAVALWGHTLLQLPADSSADALRHKLLARMGFGLLQAYGATRDPAYLVDGKEMCELYLAQHEALFGHTEAALVERGDFYELLHQFEWTLEQLPADDAKLVASASSPPAAATIEDAPEPEPEPEEPEPADDTTAQPEHELHRFIKVRRVEWARFEDPGVMEYLRDARFLGPSLLDTGLELVHGPRVLVRAGAFPRAMEGEPTAATRQAARRVGFAVIAAARPALQRCYETAMSRDPVMVARVDVQLTVEPDGTVQQARLVGGSLIDAQGDVCTAEALRDVRLEALELGEALAIAVPIQFFHQDATYAWEVTGLRTRGFEETGVTSGLPPIDQFNSPGFR